MNTYTDAILLDTARKAILAEGRAVLSLGRRLGPGFLKAAKKIYSCTGSVAVIGIGKSGLIGRKTASTLASTGTPSIFLHPVECLHGDLGMLSARDMVLALSYSGETEEMSRLIPLLRERGLCIISITGKPASRMGKLSDIVIPVKIAREACPYNITPTASTAAMLALGDALALTLMKMKGFGKTDFADLHPGGNLGKILTLKVRDIMNTGKKNPVVRETDTVKMALAVMTRTHAGATSVVNSKGALTGFFTDGDLRRKLGKDIAILSRTMARVMTKDPVCVYPETMAVEAARIISTKRIDNLPVVNPATRKPVGILDERDIISEGLI